MTTRSGEGAILAVDVGGSHVKLRISSGPTIRRFASGPTFTPPELIEGICRTTADWGYDRVTIGYPGPVHDNAPVRDPAHLGPGWVGFDYATALGAPVQILNDAAMQALGSYQGGRMLFLGLGTGLGSALVLDGLVQPTELAHLPYRKKRSFEDYVGERGLERLGRNRWRRAARDVVHRLAEALQTDYVVIGGGNGRLLKETAFRGDVRLGDNSNAFIGGFRVWQAGAATRKE